MDKKKRNEEIQSRREFFKNAGKKALPILGAIALVNMPQLLYASESTECKYCNGSCSSGCRHTCEGDCNGKCRYSCYGSCSGGCKDSCSHGCTRTSY